MVKLLLKVGARVNEADYDGRTPLILAVNSGMEDAVKLLLDRGADVNAESDYGETAFALATIKKQKNILKMIFAAAEKKHIYNGN
jgi:ankyrin repeat protein